MAAVMLAFNDFPTAVTNLSDLDIKQKFEETEFEEFRVEICAFAERAIFERTLNDLIVLETLYS